MSFVEQLGLWWQQPARTVEESTLKSPLPPQVRERLVEAVGELPVPEPFAEAIHEGMLEAIAAWQQEPERSNSLVILGSPAEPIAEIVRQSLLQWDVLDQRSLKIIQWNAIPAKPDAFVSGLRKTVREQLQGETEKLGQVPLRFSADGVQLETERRSQRGVVLPSLTQYFVRCIEGLEGVIYLRKEILKTPRRFWIVGCNLWSWQYLSYVSQMDAYFEHVVTLPALTGEQLRQWLAQVKPFSVIFSRRSTPLMRAWKKTISTHWHESRWGSARWPRKHGLLLYR